MSSDELNDISPVLTLNLAGKKTMPHVLLGLFRLMIDLVLAPFWKKSPRISSSVSITYARTGNLRKSNALLLALISNLGLAARGLCGRLATSLSIRSQTRMFV